jgi:hypothetical protein
MALAPTKGLWRFPNQAEIDAPLAHRGTVLPRHTSMPPCSYVTAPPKLFHILYPRPTPSAPPPARSPAFLLASSFNMNIFFASPIPGLAALQLPQLHQRDQHGTPKEPQQKPYNKEPPCPGRGPSAVIRRTAARSVSTLVKARRESRPGPASSN